MYVQKINKQIVKPIKGLGIDKKMALGHELFSEVNSNILLLAKKKSGKTTVINKILKECADERTMVVIFCSTLYKDNSYKKIIQRLKKKKIPVKYFTSLYDEQKRNRFKMFIEEIGDESIDFSDDTLSSESDESFGMDDIFKPYDYYTNPKRKERKPREKKTEAPELIFIFDDLISEMRDTYVNAYFSKNRHYKSKVIASVQYLKYLLPTAYQNLDYCLVFKNIDSDKLMILHERLDLKLPFDQFYDLYLKATNYSKYSFFYIDVNNESFRINFDMEIKL